MQFLITDRQEGKTTKMLAWMKAAPDDVKRVCVCHSRREAERLRELYNFDNMGEGRQLAFDWQFVTIGQLYHMRGLKNLEIGFDNVDLILQSLAVVHPVSFVTATGELYEG